MFTNGEVSLNAYHVLHDSDEGNPPCLYVCKNVLDFGKNVDAPQDVAEDTTHTLEAEDKIVDPCMDWQETAIKLGTLLDEQIILSLKRKGTHEELALHTKNKDESD